MRAMGIANTSLFAFAFTAVSPVVSESAWPSSTFRSLPTAQPLALNVTQHGQTEPGCIFYAPDGSIANSSQQPIIADRKGSPIWVGPKTHAFNFGPYTYRNAQVLAFWNGTVFPEPVGRGFGSIHILDDSYATIAEVTLGGIFHNLNGTQTFPSNIDLHEIYITSRDTLLVTANNVTSADLSSVGGPKHGWTVNSMIFEIDIATNSVIFSWEALDHLNDLPFSASVLPLGNEGFNGTTQATAWNYFHINTVRPLPSPDGGYIISSRYLCCAMALDANGTVLWRLSGLDGADFRPTNNASFCYQHDVHALDAFGGYSTGGRHLILAMHDNANSPLTLPEPSTPTTALILLLDLKERTVTALARFPGPDDGDVVYSTAQGSARQLQNGNWFLGHGFTPVMREFRNGEEIWRAQFGPVEDGLGEPQGGLLSYRAFKGDWVGCPKTKPDVAVEKDGEYLRVYASWNGATEVDSWSISTGSEKKNLRHEVQVAKEGFETVARIRTAESRCAQVCAVMKSGNRCDCDLDRASDVVCVELT